MIRTTLSEAIIPAKTSSSLYRVRGTLSPVRAAVLNEAESSSKNPSRGTFSPTFTSMVSPGCTFSGAVILYVLLYTTVAVSGRTSNNALMLLRALCTALCWNHSPMR